MPDTSTAVLFSGDTVTPTGVPTSCHEAAPTDGAFPFKTTDVMHPISRNMGILGAVGTIGTYRQTPATHASAVQLSKSSHTGGVPGMQLPKTHDFGLQNVDTHPKHPGPVVGALVVLAGVEVERVVLVVLCTVVLCPDEVDVATVVFCAVTVALCAVVLCADEVDVATVVLCADEVNVATVVLCETDEVEAAEVVLWAAGLFGQLPRAEIPLIGEGLEHTPSPALNCAVALPGRQPKAEKKA
jgi:hypothetical protein